MRDDIFWTLIARLGPDLRASRLTLAVGALTPVEALHFGCALQRFAAELDTLPHRRYALQAGSHVLTGPDLRQSGRPASLGMPCLQELQLTVVALGRDTWAAVAAVPVLLAASWPVELGRHLLALTDPDPRLDPLAAAT